MIKSFKSKGLEKLFLTGMTRKIQVTFHARCLARLDIIHRASKPEAINVPGFNFHPLRGINRYTVHVNGPWCITFEFRAGDAYHVDFEQYH